MLSGNYSGLTTFLPSCARQRCAGFSLVLISQMIPGILQVIRSGKTGLSIDDVIEHEIEILVITDFLDGRNDY